MLKNFFGTLMACILVMCIVAGCSNIADKSDNTPTGNVVVTEKTEGNKYTTSGNTIITTPSVKIPETTQAEVSDYTATISIKDYGDIEVYLEGDIAPITVQNFVDLVNSGFYEGKTFHRIMSGFMIQGGSSDGLGYTGSDKTIKGEFAANGVTNPISHVRGVISMARANDFNSGSSQFFIVHEDSIFLDGGYAAFGYVTSGIEVVDEICRQVIPVDNNGKIPAENQPIIEKIVVTEVK